MKIYTRTGDTGETGLVGGGRIRKDSLRIGAIGDVDELNAAIGIARILADGSLSDELGDIQCWLFDLGAELASPTEHARMHRALSQTHVGRLERSIDEMTDRLEPLRNFILPGGSEFGARLHFARCLCRRAERSILELDAQEAVSDEAKTFMNRLSDWLFVAARTANRLSGVQDVEWRRTGEKDAD